jgi:hypothetical protein
MEFLVQAGTAMSIFEHPMNYDLLKAIKDCPEGSHIFIQWKGTRVCADVYCSCGAHGHVDVDFFYFYKCTRCNKVWEVGCFTKLYEVTDEQNLKALESDERLNTSDIDMDKE